MTPRPEHYRTRQRADILACLREQAGRCLTVSDIAARLRESGHPAGVTTIYRTLRRLLEQGLAREFVAAPGAPASYEYVGGSAGRESYLHVRCRGCGELFNLPCQEVGLLSRQLTERLPDDGGLRLDLAATLISGLCRHCADPRGPAPAK